MQFIQSLLCRKTSSVESMKSSTSPSLNLPSQRCTATVPRCARWGEHHPPSAKAHTMGSHLRYRHRFCVCQWTSKGSLWGENQSSETLGQCVTMRQHWGSRMQLCWMFFASFKLMIFLMTQCCNRSTYRAAQSLQVLHWDSDRQLLHAEITAAK